MRKGFVTLLTSFVAILAIFIYWPHTTYGNLLAKRSSLSSYQCTVIESRSKTPDTWVAMLYNGEVTNQKWEKNGRIYLYDGGGLCNYYPVTRYGSRRPLYRGERIDQLQQYTVGLPEDRSSLRIAWVDGVKCWVFTHRLDDPQYPTDYRLYFDDRYGLLRKVTVKGRVVHNRDGTFDHRPDTIIDRQGFIATTRYNYSPFTTHYSLITSY